MFQSVKIAPSILSADFMNLERDIRLIEQAFPDREMVPIDCRAVIRQHGSLHCCTMQFPKI